MIGLFFLCQEETIELDKKRLYQDLCEVYTQKHKKSEEFFKHAKHYQIHGGSHNLRLNSPFPFYDVSCLDSKVTDVDGNTYIDFWQGHYANILGHNPEIINEALQVFFKNRRGLVTGFPGQYQAQLAELIIKQTGFDKIRFTTSGTLSSMYSIMLSKSFTQRELVLKVGGGWHGAQPYALKGITNLSEDGTELMESAGLSRHIDSSILITKFNDPEDLEDKFRLYGDRTACLIMEPFLGVGGFIFGQKEYIKLARKLTQKYGTMLIFDEVISGFRFHAGGVNSFYNVDPDLSIFGKTVGGGMPVSAVAGREDLLSLCGPEAPAHLKVKFDGGTFSAHPASMYAGIIFLQHLIDEKEKIYPQIGRLGNSARTKIEKIFNNYGINVKCSGLDPDVIKASSLVGVHFLHENIDRISSPDHVWNPEKCDIEMREKIFKLAMINEGFNIFHGYGAVSFSHTDEEIQASLDAVERIARKFVSYKK